MVRVRWLSLILLIFLVAFPHLLESALRCWIPWSPKQVAWRLLPRWVRWCGSPTATTRGSRAIGLPKPPQK